jgi:hypothetical protein
MVMDGQILEIHLFMNLPSGATLMATVLAMQQTVIREMLVQR